MKLIKFIPNLFTLGNLTLGVCGIAVLLTQPENAIWVPYMILTAAILDFLDGFLAKALNAQSPIGAQLDSLADLITFGVLPGFIYWHLTPDISWNWAVLLVPICSAWRLAKFNVGDDQNDSFIGISTTAHGIFVATIPLIIASPIDQIESFVNNQTLLIGLSIGFSWLMVSNLRMISLKFKNMVFRENWDRFVLIIGSLILIGLFGWSSSPIIMLLYLLLSLYGHFKSA